MHKSGWHLAYRGKPASYSIPAKLEISWGIFWRLLILLAPFQTLLILAVWLFLPIGVFGQTGAGLLLWLYTYMLYALTCMLGWLWLLRFPYGWHRYQI
jgi:hypothetical protein